jgi:asparagine synthase (glutamine-hydrolysing)
VYVTAEETQRSIPDLPHYYDEPFADASQLPTLLVSKLARSDVTVALSGDGGDELFGGYNRHLWLTKIARFNRFAPFFARRALSRVLRQVGAQVPSDRSHAVVAAVQRGLRLRNLGLKADKLAPLLLLDGSEEMYERVIATWNDAAEVVIGEVGPQKSNDRPLSSGFHRDGAAAMMLMDLTSYLPDGVLTKIDRASMSVGLEARVPLLDHRIVEFALRLPLGWKIRSGKGKWILRELLSRHLPRKIFERPKAGFGIPIGGWLRGPLRNWAEDLLDEAKLDREGFLNTRRVRSVWEQHLKGKGDWQQHLWCVLMFEAWLGAQSKISTTRNHHEPLTVSGLPLSSVAR